MEQRAVAYFDTDNKLTLWVLPKPALRSPRARESSELPASHWVIATKRWWLWRQE